MRTTVKFAIGFAAAAASAASCGVWMALRMFGREGKPSFADRGERPASAPAGVVTKPPAGHWAVQRGQSRMDDTPNVTLSLAAAEPIRDWLGRTHVPTLIVRCKERETTVYVVTHTQAQPEVGLYGKATVTVRFDDARPERLVADESTDNTALFLPRGVLLAKRLAKSKQLLFRFVPFNSSPQETTFALEGLGSVLPEVSEACGWGPAAEAKALARRANPAAMGTAEFVEVANERLSQNNLSAAEAIKWIRATEARGPAARDVGTAIELCLKHESPEVRAAAISALRKCKATYAVGSMRRALMWEHDPALIQALEEAIEDLSYSP